MRTTKDKRSNVVSTALTKDEYVKFNIMKTDKSNQTDNGNVTVSTFLRDTLLAAIDLHFQIYYPNEGDEPSKNVSKDTKDTDSKQKNKNGWDGIDFE